MDKETHYLSEDDFKEQLLGANIWLVLNQKRNMAGS